MEVDKINCDLRFGSVSLSTSLIILNTIVNVHKDPLIKHTNTDTLFSGQQEEIWPVWKPIVNELCKAYYYSSRVIETYIQHFFTDIKQSSLKN